MRASLFVLCAGVVRTSVFADGEATLEEGWRVRTEVARADLTHVEAPDGLQSHAGSPLWQVLEQVPGGVEGASHFQDWALVSTPLVGHTKSGYGSIPPGARKEALPSREVLTVRMQCNDPVAEREDAQHIIHMAHQGPTDVDLYTSSEEGKQRVGSFVSDSMRVIYEYSYSINSNRPNGEPYVKGISGTSKRYSTWKETIQCNSLSMKFYQSQPLWDAVPNSAAKTLNVLLGERVFTNVEVPRTNGQHSVMFPFVQKCEMVHDFSTQNEMQSTGKKVITPAHCSQGKNGAVVFSGEWKMRTVAGDGQPPDVLFYIGRVVWYLEK